MFLQIEKLRKQAEDQEATLLAQEDEVHGKQRELDALKEEEKKLMEEIKASEKEIQKLSHDLEISSEINSEVCTLTYFTPLKWFIIANRFRSRNSKKIWTRHTNTWKRP